MMAEPQPIRPPEWAPPQNVEAEAAVLGSALLDRTVITRLAPSLGARDFYSPRYALIYQAMLDLVERGELIDLLTVLSELERSGRIDQVGGPATVNALVTVVPTPIHAEQYARLVSQTALKRRLISAGGRVTTLGSDPGIDAETALARAEQVLAEVAGSAPAADFVTIAAGLSRYVERLALRADPSAAPDPIARQVPTTYRDLDLLLGGGLSRGELVLLAGRPGMGKSSLALELVARAATTYPVRVAIFSLEMGADALLGRMVAVASGIPIRTLESTRLSPSQQEVLGTALGRLAQTNVLIDDAATLSLAMLRSRVRRLATIAPLDLVVVDHIQLVSAQAENRVAEMGEISRALKALAREQNLVVLALSQLSRLPEQRSDKRPLLSDLRESGALEQDADVVALLYREEYYKPDTEQPGVTELSIAKNRNGRTGPVTLIWNNQTTGFRGLESYGI